MWLLTLPKVQVTMTLGLMSVELREQGIVKINRPNNVIYILFVKYLILFDSLLKLSLLSPTPYSVTQSSDKDMGLVSFRRLLLNSGNIVFYF